MAQQRMPAAPASPARRAARLAARLSVLVLGVAGALTGCNCTTTQKNLCVAVTCQAADACHTAGVCDPATGKCSSPAAPDGTSCADANLCNGAEVCTAGVCAAKAGTAVVCDAPAKCHTATGATCDPATGACAYPNAADNTPCADGNLCNGDEVCTAGVCAAKAGTVVVCDAPAACHVAAGATCDPSQGSCTYPPAPDGTACTFTGACAGAVSCQGGACACQVATAGVRVLAPGGSPIAGAAVQSGDTVVSTSAAGVASFTLVPGERTVLQVSAAGFTEGSAVLTAPPAASFEAVVYLLPRGEPIAMDTTVGLSAHSWSAKKDEIFRDAVVDLPPSDYRDVDGGVVDGIAQVTLTALDPTTSQREAAPGPFVGLQTDGGTALLEPLGLVELDLSQGGLPLGFGEAFGTLHLTLPAAQQGAAVEGDPLGVWHYNGRTGQWDEWVEGAAAWNSNTEEASTGVWGATGRSVLELRTGINQTGWYMVARPYTEQSCVRVKVVRASDGQAVPNAGVHLVGVENPGGVAGRTGVAGEAACLAFQKGGSVRVALDDPWLASRSTQTIQTVDGSAAGACGATAPACTLVQIEIASPTCVHGVVKLEGGAPAAGALVSATAGYGLAARTTKTTAGADGSYCVEAPTGTHVRLVALLDGTPGAASGTVDTGAGAATCGGSGCTEAADLTFGQGPTGLCVKGRLWEYQPAPDGPRATRLPVAAGTPVYVYTIGLDGNVTVSCPDTGPDTAPADWAQGTARLAVTALTGADGRFCAEVPPAPLATAPRPKRQAPLGPTGTQVHVVPGDCALRRKSIRDEASRTWCGVDDLVIEPDPAHGCELENCIDLGDFDFGYLYDGSGCHR